MTSQRARHWRHGFLVALAAGLVACASPSRAPADGPTLTGRLSVQIAAHEAEPARGFSGQFELSGSATAGALEVSGPLGAGLVRAAWAQGHYQLNQGQQTLEFSSLDELSRAGLGETLPLGALFDWLRGRPWPGAPYQPLPALAVGVAVGFEQLGWRIETGEADMGRLRAQRLQAPVINLRVLLDQADGS